MNPSINSCLDYLEGQDADQEMFVTAGDGLKQNILNWDWELLQDDKKSQDLLNNILELSLLSTLTGDEELNNLKTTALGQLPQLALSVQALESFKQSCDSRASAFVTEIVKAYDEDDLEEMVVQSVENTKVQEKQKQKTILNFPKAKQPFIESYYAMAAHSGFEDESISPLPAIVLPGGHLLSCAFPDPQNFCRLWFELRQGAEISSGVIETLHVGEQSLSLKSGECAVLVSRDELSDLLEGRLDLYCDMMQS
jgi:hypothetical protein